MRKRSKRVVREVRIPLTGLRDKFEQELRFGLMAARCGHFGKVNFDRIGYALNVVWAALEKNKPSDLSVMPVLEGGMRAMNDCATRCDKTGDWQLTALEQASISAAIERSLEGMTHLSVNEIARASIFVAELSDIEERKAA